MNSEPNLIFNISMAYKNPNIKSFSNRKYSTKSISHLPIPILTITNLDDTLNIISKPNTSNPMFGRLHIKETKALISIKMKKYINGVSICDLNDNVIKRFDYATEIANHLNISKTTVSKYLNKKLVYDNKYYFKINPI